MKMKVVYADGSWFIGNRNWKAMGYFFNHETKGTHHFFVVEGDESFRYLIGQELAVPINSAKYFVLNHRT
jgi:hypothetical protein